MHTTKDPAPNFVGCSMLVVIHNGDWSGEAFVAWRRASAAYWRIRTAGTEELAEIARERGIVARSGPIAQWAPEPLRCRLLADLEREESATDPAKEVALYGPALLRGLVHFGDSECSRAEGPTRIAEAIPADVLARAIALAVDARWSMLAISAIEDLEVAR